MKQKIFAFCLCGLLISNAVLMTSCSKDDNGADNNSQVSKNENKISNEDIIIGLEDLEITYTGISPFITADIKIPVIKDGKYKDNPFPDYEVDTKRATYREKIFSVQSNELKINDSFTFDIAYQFKGQDKTNPLSIGIVKLNASNQGIDGVTLGDYISDKEVVKTLTYSLATNQVTVPDTVMTYIYNENLYNADVQNYFYGTIQTALAEEDNSSINSEIKQPIIAENDDLKNKNIGGYFSNRLNIIDVELSNAYLVVPKDFETNKNDFYLIYLCKVSAEINYDKSSRNGEVIESYVILSFDNIVKNGKGENRKEKELNRLVDDYFSDSSKNKGFHSFYIIGSEQANGVYETAEKFQQDINTLIDDTFNVITLPLYEVVPPIATEKINPFN